MSSTLSSSPVTAFVNADIMWFAVQTLLLLTFISEFAAGVKDSKWTIFFFYWTCPALSGSFILIFSFLLRRIDSAVKFFKVFSPMIIVIKPVIFIHDTTRAGKTYSESCCIFSMVWFWDWLNSERLLLETMPKSWQFCTEMLATKFDRGTTSVYYCAEANPLYQEILMRAL